MCKMRILGKKGIDESDLKVKSANVKMAQKKNQHGGFLVSEKILDESLLVIICFHELTVIFHLSYIVLGICWNI